MNTEEILNLEGILLNKECVICYKNFINIKDRHYEKFLDKIIKKYNLNPKEGRKFEEQTTCMCYNTRAECLICKNSVCWSCTDKQDDYDGAKVLDGSAMYMNGYTEVVYEQLSMAGTGIITCPICRTKDYRGKITKKGFEQLMPNEILYDIKNHQFKCSKVEQAGNAKGSCKGYGGFPHIRSILNHLISSIQMYYWEEGV